MFPIPDSSLHNFTYLCPCNTKSERNQLRNNGVVAASERERERERKREREIDRKTAERGREGRREWWVRAPRDGWR